MSLVGADATQERVEIVGGEGAVSKLEKAASLVDVAVTGEHEVEVDELTQTSSLTRLVREAFDGGVDVGAGGRGDRTCQFGKEPRGIGIERGQERGIGFTGQGREDLMVLGTVVVGVLQRRPVERGSAVTGHDQDQRRGFRGRGRQRCAGHEKCGH